MSNGDFKIFFEDLCKKVFNFLIMDYNFQFIKLDTYNTSYLFSAKFKNSTTGIVISYDFREDRVEVNMVRLANGEIGYDRQRVDYLLLLRNPKAKISHVPLKDISLENSLKVNLKQFANILKEYGKDVLRGDFSIFPAIDEFEKKEGGKIRKEWGFVLNKYSKVFFETSCKKVFNFLIEEYGFRFAQLETDKSSLSCLFKSSKTGIYIRCDSSLIPPSIGVGINRLVNGQIGEWSFENQMALWGYVTHVAPEITHFIYFERIERSSCATTESYIEACLKREADILKKYCSEVLHGDFKIFSEIINNIKT